MKLKLHLPNIQTAWSGSPQKKREPASADSVLPSRTSSTDTTRRPRGAPPGIDAKPPPSPLTTVTNQIVADNDHVNTSDLLHSGFRSGGKRYDAIDQLRQTLGVNEQATQGQVVAKLVQQVPSLTSDPTRDRDQQIQALELARSLSRDLFPSDCDVVASAACDVALSIKFEAHSHSWLREAQDAGRQLSAQAAKGKRKLVTVPLAPVTGLLIAGGAVVKAASKAFKQDKTVNKALHLAHDAMRKSETLSDDLAGKLIRVFTDPALARSEHVKRLRTTFEAKADRGQLAACQQALQVARLPPLSTQTS